MAQLSISARNGALSKCAAAYALMLALAACGGGGGGVTAAQPSAPPVSTTPTVPTVPAAPATPAAPAEPAVLAFQGTPDSLALAESAAASRFLQAVALVDDPARGEVLASVAGADGPAIVALDPVSLQTRWTLAAPSYMARLVLADDGSTLYALMPDAKAVWQVDLRTRAAVRTIPMADGMAPLGLAVRPGHPGTIVVSTGRPELVSPFSRAQAYDDGVARPDWLGSTATTVTAQNGPINEVAFIDADTLLAVDTQTSLCTRQHLALNARGLATRDFMHGGSCFGDRLTGPVDGRFFMGGGFELDPATLGRRAAFPGTYNYAGGMSTIGFGVYHPGLKSYVDVAHDGTVPAKTHRVRVDQYPAEERQSIRRRFVATSGIALATRGSSASNVIVDAVPVGASRMVLAVYDEYAQGATQVALMAVDLAATAPLPAWDFSTRTAETAIMRGWALRAPVLQLLYDADMDRLIASLPLVLGPSGNSLAVIRPADGKVERIIPLNGEPGNLSLSAHGSLAYVTIPGRQLVQKVDLKAGTVLATFAHVNAGPIVVKPDDPDTIAFVGSTLQGGRLASYTNFVEAPAFITERDGLSLSPSIAVGANGNNDLVVYLQQSPPALWHFDWTAAGLRIVSSGNTVLGANGAGPKLKFGKLSSEVGIIDAATGTRDAVFAGAGIDDFTLVSAHAGVAVVHDFPKNAPALQWLQRPAQAHADLSWDPSAYVVLADPAFRKDGTYTQLNHIDTGAPGQVLMRSVGQGAFMRDFGPFAGYVYSVRPK
jgi:hypothetical protein